MRLLGRLPFVLLAVWGAVLVFSWAREVAGSAAGLLATFCYTFCPTILANGSLAHSDITVTVLYLQTLYCFWRWYARPTWVRFALAGLSLGLAMLAKLSAILLLPALGVLLLSTAVAGRPSLGVALPARATRRFAWAGGVFVGLCVLAVAVLWLGYGGSFATAPAAREPDWGLPLPGYLRAFLFDNKANAGGRTIFFLGRLLPRGSWYFFPVAFLVKTPIGILALLALGATTRAPRREGIPPLGPFLAVPGAVYAAVACFVLKVPLGIRYILPLYPLLYVFAGTRLGAAATRWRRGAALAAGAWLAVASLGIHPHYLAYFNEAVGGPRRGYRYLIESNLDWGQDLATLAAYLHARGNPPLHLAYFGREDPAAYGLRATPLRGCTPVGGIVAISVNVLQGLYFPTGTAEPPPGCFDWLRAYRPVVRPGYSIFVYELPPT